MSIKLKTAVMKVKRDGQMKDVGMIFGDTAESIAAIQKTGSDTLTEVTTKTTKAISDIDAKTRASIDSIPDDYTELNNKIDGLNEDLSQIGVARFYPLMDNGTLPNPGNANAVRTKAIPTKPGDRFRVYCNRPIAEGHYYDFAFGNSSNGTTYASIGKDSGKANYNAIEIRFQINEYDASGNVVQLRKENFSVGDVIVEKLTGNIAYDFTIADEKVSGGKLLVADDFDFNSTQNGYGITTSTNTLCTDIYHAKVGDKISLKPNGNQLNLGTCDVRKGQNTTRALISGWFTTDKEYTFTEECDYCLLVRRADSATIKKEDLTAKVVIYSSGESRALNAEARISTVENQLPNKYEIENLRQQAYLHSEDYGYFEKDGLNVWFTYTGNLTFRVAYSNDFSAQRACEIVGAEHSGTSPLGVDNCIKIDDVHDFVLDTEDASQRLKIISRTETNPNRHFVLLRVAGGQVKDGALFHYYQNWMNRNDFVTKAELDKIPSYWESSIQNVENTILSNRISGNIKSEFFFVTDVHWTSNAQQSSKLINRIGKDMSIPVVLMGGDVINSQNSTAVGGAKEITDYMSTFDRSFRVMAAIGNHDTNNNNSVDASTRLSMDADYNLMLHQMGTFSDTKSSPWISCFDDVSKKVRYIQFSCFWDRDGVKTEVLNGLAEYIGELDSSWSVVLMTHSYWNSKNAAQTAFLPGSTATAYANKILEISETCEAKIVALFVGHLHSDVDTVLTTSNGGRLLIIGTTTDSYNQYNAESNHITTDYSMSKGNTSEQAFDVVQIDTQNRTIDMTRVGVGNNRHFSY